MTKQKTYTDTVGRTFRQQGDQWQVLATGVGWVNFEGKTHIIDVGFIDQTTGNKEEEQDETEQYTAAENDLFKHYVGVALPVILKSNMETKGATFDGLAKMSCDQAQAIIDELKTRGRL